VAPLENLTTEFGGSKMSGERELKGARRGEWEGRD